MTIQEAIQNLYVNTAEQAVSQADRESLYDLLQYLINFLSDHPSDRTLSIQRVVNSKKTHTTCSKYKRLMMLLNTASALDIQFNGIFDIGMVMFYSSTTNPAKFNSVEEGPRQYRYSATWNSHMPLLGATDAASLKRETVETPMAAVKYHATFSRPCVYEANSFAASLVNNKAPERANDAIFPSSEPIRSIYPEHIIADQDDMQWLLTMDKSDVREDLGSLSDPEWSKIMDPYEGFQEYSSAACAKSSSVTSFMSTTMASTMSSTMASCMASSVASSVASSMASSISAASNSAMASSMSITVESTMASAMASSTCTTRKSLSPLEFFMCRLAKRPRHEVRINFFRSFTLRANNFSVSFSGSLPSISSSCVRDSSTSRRN